MSTNKTGDAPSRNAADTGTGEPETPGLQTSNRIVSALVIASAVFFALRFGLTLWGVWYDQGSFGFVELLGPAFLAAAILAWVFLGTSGHGRMKWGLRPGAPGRAGLASVLLLAVPISYSVQESLLPATTPAQDAAPACAGVPLYGAEGVVQTQPQGVITRTGPGLAFRPNWRYPGDCSLGFDAVCYGDAVPDNLNGGYFDDRWLRIQGSPRTEFVSAAEVYIQLVPRKLTMPTQCRQSPEQGIPTVTSFSVVAPASLRGTNVQIFPGTSPAGQFGPAGPEYSLSVGERGASMVGYAVYIPGRLKYDDGAYAEIGNPVMRLVDGSGYTFAGGWYVDTAAEDLVGGIGTVVIGATACLALHYPSGQTFGIDVHFDGNRPPIVSASHVLHGSLVRGLANEACAGGQ